MMWMLACMADDVDETAKEETGTPTETDDSGSAADGLVGDWLSEGEDLSELFAPYFTKVTASFSADGSYEVEATYENGASQAFTGSYVADEGTSPASIVLTQTSPSAAVAEGIFEVAGDVLTYEVAQTEPDQGYSPPTPESGFGTTSGGGIEAGVNVQTYRRQ